MKYFGRRAGLLALGAATVLAVAIPGGVARATTLNGDWAPFSRCPVSNSSMLAADGANVFDECIDSQSPSGTMTLGSQTVTLGESDLQLGVLVNTSTGTDTPVAPADGAVVAAPVTIPGGLLGLMCSGDVPLLTALCDSISDSSLNTVTATIEAAGTPYNLSLGASLGHKHPILSLPVMIQLSNPILGSDCFIGSTSDPIVLNPVNTAAPTGTTDFFDPNGTSDPNGVLTVATLTGMNQQDSTFAVPEATGCGPALLSPIVDGVVDLKEGLPSGSGNNILTLNDVTISLATYVDPASFAPNEGADFAAAWNSAITGG
jgi:hypothetical protein